GLPQARWRPKQVLHYIQDWHYEPDLLVDITDVFEQRMQSVLAYHTQFATGKGNSNEPQTYISTPDFYEAIIARARLMGKMIGVKYAEGFVSDKKIGIRNLDALISVET
ncbi:MAG: bacillithiol biosynthesis deacetylase BshB1, partial [Bacteroidota bacterium]|nr:bacillithiol biosynthesis deacetylase BshB1 [Bacteroidota bacterium]